MKSNDNTVLSIFVSVYTPISGSICVRVTYIEQMAVNGSGYKYVNNYKMDSYLPQGG